MEAMSLIATFSDCNEEYVDEAYEIDNFVIADVDDKSTLNSWYEKTICSYRSGKVVEKTTLSEYEIEFVKKHNLISAVDVTYCLLGKYTQKTHDEQIIIVLDILSFLGQARLPKEYLGGFLILMIKYHFLP
jgi:hypothetical protein